MLSSKSLKSIFFQYTHDSLSSIKFTTKTLNLLVILNNLIFPCILFLILNKVSFSITILTVIAEPVYNRLQMI